MPLSAGIRLGPYEVLAPLGAGGMGEVWRARDTRLGRDVALKVLPGDFARNPERLARFEREARSVAALNHPNIVTLHSIEESGETHFLTMELVEGRTLGDLVAPGGLALGELLELAIPLADALVAAHEKSIVHRDLKPANVMVTRDGRVKVLDFGLAKLTESGAALEVSRVDTMAAPASEVGQVLGTLPYMAPEQIRGGVADARSDVFSYGVLVYELAAGRRPFTGETYADVSSSILRDEPAPLEGELGRLLARCLAKNPRERVQTALDVANELRRLRKAAQLAPGQVAATKPTPAQTASIAVLPFANRSGNPDDEYFADGLADELLNVLARIRGLRVSARTSAFQFKGAKDDAASIGRKLGVATLLEGSVRKAGNRVRIAVQLVKADDGFQMWSESYDRTLDDIFAVQDDIAQSVVQSLRAPLLGAGDDSLASGEARADVARASKGRTTNPEAQRLFLLARYLFERATPEDAKQGVAYLDQAVALDPEFGQAWAELGRILERIQEQVWDPGVDWAPRARAATERALRIDPDLPEGLVNMAWIHMFQDRDWRAAEVRIRRALELAPDNALAVRTGAVLRSIRGDFEDAVMLDRRAIELDPLSGTGWMNLGLDLSMLERNEEAAQAFRKAIELSPIAPGRRALLAHVLSDMGRGQEALELARAEPAEDMRLYALAVVEHALGHRAESDAALRELEEKHGTSSAFQAVEVYAARGEIDAAFAALDHAEAVNDSGMSEILRRPSLRILYDDPRWAALRRRMGFDA